MSTWKTEVVVRTSVRTWACGSSDTTILHNATRYDSWEEAYLEAERRGGFAEEFDPPFRNADGSLPLFVNVYRVGQGYGGPEEGGWWFNCGEILFSVPVRTEAEAFYVKEQLSEEYPNTGRRSSVLGGEDYDILIEHLPGKNFPETIPHYE